MKEIKSNLRVFPMTITTLLLAIGGLAIAAQTTGEFDEADVYAELNHTDGDLGFHALIDGEAWKKLKLIDPNGKKMLNAKVNGQLKKQGLTEFFFESAEPNFDDLNPEEFFDRFAEGDYRITATTLERGILEAEDYFWHVMPAPPVPTVNGEPMAIQCDDEEPGYDISEVTPPVIIEWDPVETSHPDLGEPGEIIPALYQVVAEIELEVDGEEFTSVYSVDLPPEVTSMSIPEEFLELGEEVKYEVLVKEATGGNQTAVESCFAVEDEEG